MKLCLESACGSVSRKPVKGWGCLPAVWPQQVAGGWLCWNWCQLQRPWAARGLMLPPRGERVRRPGKGPAWACEDRSRQDPQEPGRREKGLPKFYLSLQPPRFPGLDQSQEKGQRDGPSGGRANRALGCGEPRFQKEV